MLGAAVMLATVGQAAALATSSPLTSVRAAPHVGVAPWEGGQGMVPTGGRPTSQGQQQLLAPFRASFQGHFDK